MSQEPRTSQGRNTVVYLRAAMFTLLSDPADRASAELVLRETSRRIRLTEEAAVDAQVHEQRTTTLVR